MKKKERELQKFPLVGFWVGHFHYTMNNKKDAEIERGGGDEESS